MDDDTDRIRELERTAEMQKEVLDDLVRSSAETKASLDAFTARLDAFMTRSTPPSSQTPSSAPQPQTTPLATTNSYPTGPKVALPFVFSGDRERGTHFLNACRLYFSLRPHEFPDDAAKIAWALSFMQEGAAADWADECLRTGGYGQVWTAFLTAFEDRFCPLNPKETARLVLHGNSYHQTPGEDVEKYLDRFDTLLRKADLQDKGMVVDHFRKGLLSSLNDPIATGENCPGEEDLAGWKAAVRRLSRNRESNKIFNAALGKKSASAASSLFRDMQAPRHAAPFPPQAPVQPAVRLALPPPAPRFPPQGVPMDIDAARRQMGGTLNCHRCGKAGHYSRHCPMAFDIRTVVAATREEQAEYIQALASFLDAHNTEERPLTADEKEHEEEEKDFLHHEE
jgi:uncharacterized coiled-coil protein SlyX